MKTLKFREHLSKEILAGRKTRTKRLFDEKNLSTGDVVLLLIWETKIEFARAKILSVEEKIFDDLQADDFEGHQKYASREELYAEFTGYYHRLVDGKTAVKVIYFELLSIGEIPAKGL